MYSSDTYFRKAVSSCLLGASFFCCQQTPTTKGTSTSAEGMLSIFALYPSETPSLANSALAEEYKALQQCFEKEAVALVPSPNYSPRLQAATTVTKEEKDEQEEKEEKTSVADSTSLIDTLVLHYTAGEKKRALEIFTKKNSVSAHYLVDRKGQITQLVATTDKAWHAGVSSWGGQKDVNPRAIGIETVNLGYKHSMFHPKGTKVKGMKNEWYTFDDALVSQTIKLSQHVIKLYPNILPHYVVGHSDVAPGRKVDPGPFFP